MYICKPSFATMLLIMSYTCKGHFHFAGTKVYNDILLVVIIFLIKIVNVL